MSINNPNKSGRLTIISGPMFSGKTTLLQEFISIAVKQNVSFLVCKPKIDKRYSANHIVSHLGNKIPAVVLDLEDVKFFENRNEQILFIDEFQFFNLEVAKKMLELKQKGTDITICGLQKDYLQEDFGYLSWLSAYADKLYSLEGSCDLCNMPSTHTFRKIPEKEIVLVGEKDIYLGLCKDCYTKELKNNEIQ